MTTPQEPIHSGFGPASTAADVIRGIDLGGKTAIVTGGYSGIGIETVRALRSAGAHVIVPTRNREKAVRTLTGVEGVELGDLDLLDSQSVDTFATAFLASRRPLHILVNSAAIMASPLARDSRGYESQFATNHLGHFQLYTRLLPALRHAQGARVVSVSSWGHRYSPVHFEDPNFERREYDRWAAYGQAKTANILFAVEVDARGKGEGIRAFSLHPGTILGTGLEKHVTNEELRAAGAVDEHGKPVLDPSRNLKTVEQGAATSVWCATSPRLEGLGGVYAENCDVAPIFSKDTRTPAESTVRTNGVMPYAIDRDSAKRLWALSERLLNVG